MSEERSQPILPGTAGSDYERYLRTDELLSLQKTAVAVSRCRGIGKKDMIHNDALPKIEVDAESYEVRADGQLLTCEPATVLPMAQRYFLF